MPTSSITPCLAKTSADAPVDPSAVPDLSHEVLRLTRTSQAIRGQLAAHGSSGVDWSAFLLLCPLVRLGPQRSSALAAAAHVDPSTISRQVAHLVDLGLAVRRADPEDGRATLLVATDRGHTVHAAVQQRRHGVYAQMVADWPPDDVRRLADLLGRLNDSFADNDAQHLDAIVGAGTTKEARS